MEKNALGNLPFLFGYSLIHHGMFGHPQSLSKLNEMKSLGEQVDKGQYYKWRKQKITLTDKSVGHTRVHRSRCPALCRDQESPTAGWWSLLGAAGRCWDVHGRADLVRVVLHTRAVCSGNAVPAVPQPRGTRGCCDGAEAGDASSSTDTFESQAR